MALVDADISICYVCGRVVVVWSEHNVGSNGHVETCGGRRNTATEPEHDVAQWRDHCVGNPGFTGWV
jgi:hypothetical protein